MFEKDTIAAIATGLTDSGIGIIRISGSGAVEVGDSLFRLPGGRYFLKDAASHVMQYGFAVDKNRNMEIEEDSATNGSTSKNRSGNIFRNRFSPVPSDIAAVIATTFSSRSPIFRITVEKTSV